MCIYFCYAIRNSVICHTLLITLHKKRATTCAQAAQVDDDEEEQPIQLDKVAANLRQQTAAWQRKQKEDWLRNLKENEDYAVHVQLTKAGTTSSASVECKRCNTQQRLGMSIKKRAIISN